MTNWLYTVKIRHLLTEKEDYQSIQNSMSAIADILSTTKCFSGFKNTIKKFKKIPKGNDILGPVDYGNKLLDHMYDYADSNRIWLE